jgi:hypothetical protein
MRRQTKITIAALAFALLGPLVAPLASAAGDGLSISSAAPPQTAIDDGPSGLTNWSEPSFEYSSPDERAGFECSVDRAPFERCGYLHEKIEPALTDGPHRFEVRAVDESGTVDPTPALRSFTVDATAPTVRLTSGPSGLSRDPTPSFRFRASGEDSVRCALYSDDAEFDEIPYGPCTAERFFIVRRPLMDNTYVFRVRASDRAYNEAEDTRAFRIYASPGAPPNPYAGSVLYRGGGDGIKVAFRLKHRRLIRASVFVRLNCIGPKGRRHYGRRDLGFAGAGYPLALDARGRFRFAPLADEEESLTIEESLAGRVGPGQIVGSFSYYENLDYRNRRCTTGVHPYRTARLEFHARRR